MALNRTEAGAIAPARVLARVAGTGQVRRGAAQPVWNAEATLAHSAVRTMLAARDGVVVLMRPRTEGAPLSERGQALVGIA